MSPDFTTRPSTLPYKAEVPTSNQINSIKPDQAVGYWSGSVGMSGRGRRETRELKEVPCGKPIKKVLLGVIVLNRRDLIYEETKKV
ncbi:hypothetical protein DPMN_101575 [Dreissena polymorpha]|uniref:Uncharacterized protein n=1 Tax=Dreissena polymorpha TaxID=45954 RepID=A0A9D4RA67_DREPO|nr:hypothetical protein DPMN_101575 [Dreissena polymorpha]